jgi:hypothetical protein
VQGEGRVSVSNHTTTSNPTKTAAVQARKDDAVVYYFENDPDTIQQNAEAMRAVAKAGPSAQPAVQHKSPRPVWYPLLQLSGAEIDVSATGAAFFVSERLNEAWFADQLMPWHFQRILASRATVLFASREVQTI